MKAGDASAFELPPVHPIAQLNITVLSGLREIWAHKFRSLLTMLGIILGVSSLVAMSALVAGMEKGARESLLAIGGLEKVRIEPQELPIEQRHLSEQAPGITMSDVVALRQSAPLVTALAPEMRLGANLSVNGKSFRPWLCAGVWPESLVLNEHSIQYGRMFNEIDDEMARNVCVIGTATRDELWGAPEKVGKEINPVGETVFINHMPFTIIGMFTHYESERDRQARTVPPPVKDPKTGKTGVNRDQGGKIRRNNFVFYLKNSTVYMPINTLWMKFRFGQNSISTSSASTNAIGSADPRLSTLELKIANADLLPQAVQQIRNVLMSTHKGIEDFAFRTQEDWAEQINTFIHNARMSGGLIAGISLLVGGIGIMNIMLASITERVREIGIRKSVGAGTFDIFIQILVESVVIAILGGLAGIVASFGLVQLIQRLSPTENIPIVQTSALVIAFGFSVVVGVLAGIFPALKASRLNPIQALRYE